MGWAWRKEGEVEWGGGWGFYSETANPPIKRVLFNNARQFPEVGLTPPLFYKEMIFHTQTSLIGCSRGGERALEDMKMVSFSFLLRFGSPSPFYNSSLNLIFILRSLFLQAIKSLGVIECCVWFERGKLYFLHTHPHTCSCFLTPGMISDRCMSLSRSYGSPDESTQQDRLFKLSCSRIFAAGFLLFKLKQSRLSSTPKTFYHVLNVRFTFILSFPLFQVFL